MQTLTESWVNPGLTGENSNISYNGGKPQMLCAILPSYLLFVFMHVR